MAMKCSACGGTLALNADTGKLECSFCRSIFDVTEYNIDNEATVEIDSNPDATYEDVVNQDDGGLKMNVYVCPNCGAQLTAPPEQVVAYCMYCDTEATLLSKATTVETPEYIIPFQYGKEKVIEQYMQEVKKRIFVPNEFLNPDFLEGFRGIYIPYWDTHCELDDKQLSLKGIRTHSDSSYTYTEYYDVDFSIFGEISGGFYDASAAFDDTIAAEIAPFHMKKAKPFNPGYLAGFYADKATTQVETYEPLIRKNTVENVDRQIKKLTKDVQLKDLDKHISYHRSDTKSVLFPVWFLTYRKKNRVAYSVMNAETGKLSIDLPVSFPKYMRAVLIMTAILFTILSFVSVFIHPICLACLSAIALYFSSSLLRTEIRQIRLIETHVYDWGDRFHKTKKRAPGKSKIGESFGLGVALVKWICIGMIAIAAFDCTEPEDLFGISMFMMLFQIWMSASIIWAIRGIRNILAIFPAILDVIVLYAGMTLATTGAYDYLAYSICIAYLIGIIINVLTCMGYVKYLTTRPVPNFYSREGANNGR